jgi:hypothetical protein
MSETQSAPARTLAYVDAIEEGVTRLVLRDALGEWRSFNLPRAVLPADVRENQWIELTVARTEAPPEAETAGKLRERLGRSDPGGDFSL